MKINLFCSCGAVMKGSATPNSKALPVTNVLGKYDGTGGDKRFHRWGQEANTARYYIVIIP